MTEPLLRIDRLSVAYHTSSGTVRAVDSVDLTINPGEVVALVGESGSGKSTTAHAIIGLLPGTGRIDAGQIDFAGRDLVGISERSYQAIRGRQIGLIPQDPTVSLNPVKRIGEQVGEVLRTHGLADRKSVRVEVAELLGRAGLPDPAVRMRQYPHELSGGMRQRVLIAIAIAAGPRLIIADEPTSALDVTVQRHILDHIEDLTTGLGTAVLLITHDLAVAADRAQKIVVMSQGTIVETGPAAQILTDPEHEYTRRLLRSAPGLAAGSVTQPPVQNGTPLLVAEHLIREFRLPAGRSIRAVDDVSFTIGRGETLGLVGESGSGKSTTARLALRLTKPTSGRIHFDGQDITGLKGTRWRALRRRAQIVYQNPYASLDPRQTVADIVGEPLRVFRVADRTGRHQRARELLDRVALPETLLGRKPAELSGGQRQRVAIARALALKPDLVVCDEPVSALDVSVQAQVLELLAELQLESGLSYLFISHDLAVVRQIAHRVGVMQAGRLVEIGPTARIFEAPEHDYTRELLAAIPGQRYVS